ncbi:MAG: PEP-CTERM sorting domain-containing protein [Pirellulales bacterium]|nr:PEP-CTERM sorting domain-containing protein [Pirellulales bacterium]
MLRTSFSTLAAVLLMGNVSYGLVTLSYTQNSDPAPGYKSYTVQATGVGINVLGGFEIIGDVYQVWTDEETQSEWLYNYDGNTPGHPMDSHVAFGAGASDRLADMPNTYGGIPEPWFTHEHIYEGGTEGLGDLRNGGGLSGGVTTSQVYTGSMLPGDANGDEIVDAMDLQILSANWYHVGAGGWVEGDFDGDGFVGPVDASVLAAHWHWHLEPMGDPAGGCEYTGMNDGGGTSESDAYLSLGTPSETATTVDLLHLVVPEGAMVAVELELITTEYHAQTGYYTNITSYCFAGESALIVPEPSTLALLVMGIAGLAVMRQRKR